MIVRGMAQTERKNDIGRIVRTAAIAGSLVRRHVEGMQLLIQHDEARPAGRILGMERRPQGFWIEALLDPSLPGVIEFIGLIRRRAKGIGFSVGCHDCHFRRMPGGVIAIDQCDLREVSIAHLPRNSDCGFVYPTGDAEWDSHLASRVGMARTLNLPTVRYEQEPV